MKSVQASMREKLLHLLVKAAEQEQSVHFNSFYDVQTPKECDIALHPENRPKNRGNFWGLPYDHNLIQSIPGYINASPMEFDSQRYIAAQGPRQNTQDDFWHMVWAENVTLIVTVTNEQEMWKGLMQMKFERFWPRGYIQQYGQILVEQINDQFVKEWEDGRAEKIRLRLYNVTNNDQKRQIAHLHLENWPDNGVVHPESLIALAEHTDEWKQNGTIAVHCAAGVGRTGTFIAYHSLYHAAKRQLQQNMLPEIDVLDRIHSMRSKRWGAMVAAVEQYHLLLEALRLSLVRD